MKNTPRWQIGLSLAAIIAVSVATSSQSLLAQTEYTWTNVGTGDWGGTGINYNWDDPVPLGTDPRPEGRFAETALINNGGTAQVTTVYDNSGTGTFGPGEIVVTGGSTLQITSTGNLQTDLDPNFVVDGSVQIGMDDPNLPTTDGFLTIDSGGSLTANRLRLFQPGSTIDLDGTASITLTGTGTGDVANLSRNVRITGPSVNFTTNSLLLGDNTVLIPEITDPNDHSIISVTTNATLDGSVQAEFNGVTPSVGDTWNLIEAGNVSGSFTSVTAPGVSLLPGQSFEVNEVDNGGTTLVQLELEQKLYLEVNRDTGAVSIKSSDSTAIPLEGYTIGSGAGHLDPNSGWSSLASQGIPGWVEANPLASRLSEFNASGTTGVDSGSALSLGNAYAPSPAAFADPVDDLTFQYTSTSGELVTSVVEYTGIKVNTMVLIVDPNTGDGQIRNASDFNASIEGLTIQSPSGSLDPNGWSSLADQSVSGWVEANPDPNGGRLSEFNISGSTLFTADGGFNIGDLFDGAVVEDLTFEFLLEGESVPTAGVVFYQPLTPLSVGIPGDFNGDGRVDGTDFLAWQRGESPNPFSGSDLDDWENNFGQPVASNVTSVPEPSTTCMLLPCLLCAGMTGRGGRQARRQT